MWSWIDLNNLKKLQFDQQNIDRSNHKEATFSPAMAMDQKTAEIFSHQARAVDTGGPCEDNAMAFFPKCAL